MFKQPLQSLNKVGAKIASKFNKLNIKNTLDLIYHFPLRYEDFSQITKINELQPDQQTTILGKIELLQNKRSWRSRLMITEAVISDDTESIKIIWFNQPYIVKTLQAGDEIYIAGKVTQDKYGLSFKNPIYEKAKEKTTHTARIVPLYNLSEGITQKQIRFLLSQVVQQADVLADWLPDEIIQKNKLISLNKALKQIHFPDNWDMLRQAQKRLSFDELVTIALYNLKNKQELEAKNAIAINFNEAQIKKFVAALPFKLTTSQKKCAWQIINDLEQNKPMNRLLEGDVGSGKTIVAALAMYNVALAGYQSVFMVPTEILAKQHMQTLENILGKDSVSLVTKNTKKINPDEKIIVGTHALLYSKVKFSKLALAIIDEQHRFGVEQRKKLQNNSGDSAFTPHLLSMTATPIPRTLALTVYGDLDLSIIDELPAGRKRIITKIVSEENRNKAYEFIRKKIMQGQQCFVICPLISESDKLGFKSVEMEYKKMKNEIFPDLNIAKLHGKLKPQEKDNLMQDFKDKKFNILVSTSVIEVGVDVPNATMMIIEGADRFGLAQLHQFRGRVGRSDLQSYCLLFTESKSSKTKKRLEALVNSNNGFKLAEEDLKLRGPGEVYGNTQSGFISSLKIANLNDHVLLAQARDSAIILIKNVKKYPLVQKKIEKFTEQIHLE